MQSSSSAHSVPGAPAVVMTTDVPRHCPGRGWGRVIPLENHCPRLSGLQEDQALCGGDKAVALDWVPGKASKEVILGHGGEEGARRTESRGGHPRQQDWRERRL